MEEGKKEGRATLGPSPALCTPLGDILPYCMQPARPSFVFLRLAMILCIQGTCHHLGVTPASHLISVRH